jgi:hypothetical protein
MRLLLATVEEDLLVVQARYGALCRALLVSHLRPENGLFAVEGVAPDVGRLR